MLATLPPLPADRLEPAARTSTTDAGIRSAAGERFADLLERRRSASDAAGQRAAARERGDAPCAALQRPPAKAPARHPGAGEVAVEDDAARTVGPALGLPESPPPVAGAEAVAPRPEGAEAGSSTNPVPLPIAFGAGVQAAVPDADSGTALAPEDPLRPAAARGPAARGPARVAGSAGEEAGRDPAVPAEHADGAAQPAPPAGAATPEVQRQAIRSAGGDVPALAPGPAPSMRPSQAVASVAAPAVDLPCAPDAQAFGPLLGVQVSLFARDGVQQAELRLNPPETGPIGVQIEIVGSDARVNFHAAQAPTREAIERALPELAASLRGEGLTLTGGSVSDRPADPRGDGTAPQAGGARRHAGPAAEAVRGAAAPHARPVTPGRIDLYA